MVLFEIFTVSLDGMVITEYPYAEQLAATMGIVKIVTENIPQAIRHVAFVREEHGGEAARFTLASMACLLYTSPSPRDRSLS
eukprot:2651424-Pyramimonas_sp.AAC.1